MTPKLSIILPSLRTDNCLKCLTSIWANSYTVFETIVVGDKELQKWVYENKTNESCDKFVIDDKCIGTTYAIQKGLEVATGEYVVCLSDDARPAPHWDDHMINFLSCRPKNNIVLGNFRVFDHTGEMNKIGYFGRQFSMFPIMRRKDIEMIGGYYLQEFNAFFADPDLGQRVSEIGKIITCPTAFIYHVYNADMLHKHNKDMYWMMDEQKFIEKWGHLGKYVGCEVIK